MKSWRFGFSTCGERLSPLALDVSLVVVVGIAISTTIAAANEPGSREPDVLAYGLGLMMATLLLGRRRWPVRILLATVAVFTLYAWLNYPW
jgi:hypothetical protein